MRSFIWSLAALSLLCAPANATIRITEWMYSGTPGEFIEITNVGGAAVNLTGWSYDDNSATAGSESLSSLATLAAGESAILTEASDVAFRTEWSLAPVGQGVGGVLQNLGRSDQINIYDASSTLVDRLTYDDQGIVGSIRTQNTSGNPGSLAVLGTNNVLGWVLSSAGDIYGSVTAPGTNIANPGRFALYAPVPEPATMAITGVAIAMVGLVLRRK